MPSPGCSAWRDVCYRTLPSTAANEKLFDLAVQHPQARVVSRVLVAPSSGPPGRR
jgi:hypothetical protein